MLENQKLDFWKRVQNVGSFYEKNLTEMMLSIWWESLKSQDFEAVCGAFGRHVADPDRGMWMPKPADVMALIHGKSSESSELAWGKLIKGMGRAGKNNDVVFDDALIHATVEDMGGWIKVCSVDGDKEVAFMRLHFLRCYQAYRQRGELPEYPRVLTGMSNLSNAANGFRLARPLAIGDVEKVRIVFEGGGNGSSIRVVALSIAVMAGVERAAGLIESAA